MKFFNLSLALPIKRFRVFNFESDLFSSLFTECYKLPNCLENGLYLFTIIQPDLKIPGRPCQLGLGGRYCPELQENPHDCDVEKGAEIENTEDRCFGNEIHFVTKLFHDSYLEFFKPLA